MAAAEVEVVAAVVADEAAAVVAVVEVAAAVAVAEAVAVAAVEEDQEILEQRRAETRENVFR